MNLKTGVYTKKYFRADFSDPNSPAVVRCEAEDVGACPFAHAKSEVLRAIEGHLATWRKAKRKLMKLRKMHLVGEKLL